MNLRWSVMTTMTGTTSQGQHLPLGLPVYDRFITKAQSKFHIRCIASGVKAAHRSQVR